MKGKVSAFRGSYKTKHMNQIIVIPDGIHTKDKALALIGKTVAWNNPEGKKKIVISGKVSAAHGSKGAVRVIFERGLPGQSLGTDVEIQ